MEHTLKKTQRFINSGDANIIINTIIHSYPSLTKSHALDKSSFFILTMELMSMCSVKCVILDVNSADHLILSAFFLAVVLQSFSSISFSIAEKI